MPIRRTLATVLLVVVAALALGAAPASAGDTGDEAGFLTRLNDLRTSQGLPTLASNSALTGVARAWAGSMAAAGTISHNRSLALQGPSNWARLGENVGMGMDVPSVHNAFVDSPAHYRNMVDAGFDSVGIGVVRNGSGILFVAVNFMQAQAVAVAAPAPPAAPKPAAPAPAPAPVATPAPSPARPAPALAAPAVAAAPAPAVAQPPAAPVAPPATTPEAAPVALPVASAPAAPVTAAARTTSVVARSDSASSSSAALGLVCAGVLLAMVAGGRVAFRPQRRAAALARR